MKSKMQSKLISISTSTCVYHPMHNPLEMRTMLIKFLNTKQPLLSTNILGGVKIQIITQRYLYFLHIGILAGVTQDCRVTKMVLTT